MHGEPPAEEKVADVKWGGFTPVDDQRFPGLLVDLDDTLVTQPNGFTKQLGLQSALPNRHEILKQFKDKGYKIIGITNRAIHAGEPWGIDDLMSLNKETLELFKGLLDDIVCCAVTSEHQKPAPIMIHSAMTTHGLDPNNTVFVGDSPKDEQAAAAANIPYYHPDEFFNDPADWTDDRNMQAHVLKHGPEFGGADSYLALEKEISSAPPEDMTRVNQRCTTQFRPNGTTSTRCATGYHSPSTQLMHVRDDNTGKTVTLYKKSRGLLSGS